MNQITSPDVWYKLSRLSRRLFQWCKYWEFECNALARGWNGLRIVNRLSRPHSLAWRFLALLFLTVSSGTLTFGQAQDVPVATVNGRSITQREVDSLVVAQTLPLEEKLYAIRKAALENLITSRVLEDEATKRGILVGELRRQLAAGEVEVTSNEVEAAYAENASFFASISPDEAKERLRLDLANQKRMQNYRVALVRLRQAAKIELLLQEPRVLTLAGNSVSSSLGPADAAVTVVEYSDYECPYCRQAQSVLKQIITAFDQKIRVVFKHLPLQIHKNAFPAAQAAFCASQQGMFWQYHDALFSGDSITPTYLNRIAANLGLNLSRFNECIDSEAARTAVRLDVHEANQLGINSTPAFIINGKLVRGAISFEEFKAIVERELKTAQDSSQPQQPQPARKD